MPRPSRIRSPGPTLYAALGTAFLDRSDALQLVADAMGRLGVSGLLAVGDLDPALVRVPPGVQVEGLVHQLDQLDQLAALAHTSVFATHAGMGAVMESLAAGIPMLCFPQTTEQAMVASRVAELGLGLVGLVGEPTSVDAVTHVATQLSRLLEDRELRDRVRAFGSTCPTTRESVPPTSSRTQRPTAPRPRGPPQDCQVSLRLLVSGSRPSRRGGPLDTD